MHGVLAVGDSIVNGHAGHLRGVPGQSFGLWLAQAQGWCFTTFSRGGATSSDVVAEQIPRLRDGDEYRVGIVGFGTNDAIQRLEADAFQQRLELVAQTVAAIAQHLVIVNILESSGQIPGAPDRSEEVAEINATIASVAAADAILLDISTMRGPRLVHPDRVHPSAIGQLVMSDHVAALLRNRGVAINVQPSTIYGPKISSPLRMARIGHAAETVSVWARQTVKRALSG